MRTRKAVSSILLLTMLTACAEQIVAPTADISVKVEYADGRTERVVLSQSEINMARASMPQRSEIDTVGLKVVRVGNTVVVSRFDKQLTSITQTANNYTVLTNGTKYTVEGKLPPMPQPVTHADVSLQTALPCWFWYFAMAAAAVSLIACTTLVACTGAVAGLVITTDQANNEGCINIR